MMMAVKVQIREGCVEVIGAKQLKMGLGQNFYLGFFFVFFLLIRKVGVRKQLTRP